MHRFVIKERNSREDKKNLVLQIQDIDRIKRTHSVEIPSIQELILEGLGQP